MARTWRSIGMIVLIVALAFLAACADDTTPGGSGTPTPTPSETTWEEPEWTIVTPVGWTSEDVTDDADAEKAIRYSDTSGNFVIVHIDPLGSDFATDVIWRYEVSGSSFEIVDKEECTSDTPQCSTDDNRFDGYALWESGSEPQEVGGHVWYFAFGNTTTTEADESLYEDIIESLSVTG